MTDQVLTTEQRIRDIIARECCVEDLDANRPLLDQELDSLDVCELFMEVETEFRLPEFSDDEQDELDPLQKIVAHVDRKKRQ